MPKQIKTMLFLILLVVSSCGKKDNSITDPAVGMLNDTTVIIDSDSVGNWVKTAGLYNGAITAFCKSGSILFAGTYGNGVFESANDGATWTSVNNLWLQGDEYIYCLVASGKNICAGEGEGIYLTANNGATWYGIYDGLVQTSVLAFAVVDTFLFAGTPAGIIISTNNGLGWSNPILKDTSVKTFAVSDTNLYANTDYGVFRTINKGVSWSKPLLSNLYVYSLVVSGTNLIAGTYKHGAYLSEDNGTSWDQITKGLPANISVLSFAANGTNTFLGTDTGGVFLSTNKGTDWTRARKGLPNIKIRSLIVCGSWLIAGTDSGAYRRPLSELITSN
jgi:photosystem II stability/assembly factor-like uncharacterized protein